MHRHRRHRSDDSVVNGLAHHTSSRRSKAPCHSAGKRSTSQNHRPMRRPLRSPLAFDRGDDTRQLVGVDAVQRVAETETVPQVRVDRRAAPGRPCRDGHRLGRQTRGVQRDTHPAGRFPHTEFGREVSDDIPPFRRVVGCPRRGVVVRASTRHRNPRWSRCASAIVVEPLPIPCRVGATEIGKGHREVGRVLQSSTCQREIASSGAPVKGA